MSRKKKILIGVGVLVVLGGVAFANFRFKRTVGITVNTEAVKKRKLDAIVSASGKIQPKRFVNISADTSGRVTDLAVNEGDRVTQGQFLMQIDPRNLKTRVTSGEASLGAAQSTAEQLKLSLESSRTQLKLAQDNYKRQQELWKGGLTTREQFERAESELRVREQDLRAQEQNVLTQTQRMRQEQATLENARTDLSKVRIESPINGIVTRRNIEQGETAVVGTMNNAGTILLPGRRHVDHRGRGRSRRDRHSQREDRAAREDHGRRHDRQELHGQGHRDRQQPDPDERTDRLAGDQLQGDAAGGRRDPRRPPRLHLHRGDHHRLARERRWRCRFRRRRSARWCSTRRAAIVREPVTPGAPRRPAGGGVQAAELKPGQERKEVEGVFVVRDGKAMFEVVKTGIAGEKYFEVLSGLKDGDAVIVGPFSSVRSLGGRHRRQGGRCAAGDRHRRKMNFFIESASIALQAIWSNKLRSFLTVLGNIVAVTSIIAVVSLIQGMNAYVTDTIVSGVGTDQFTIQRMPVVRTEADEERVRNNPRLTLKDASAVREASDNIGAVAAQAFSGASVSYHNEQVDGVQVRGVSRDYIYFSTFDVERGRLINPAEIDANRPVAVLGWEVADKVFGPADPLEKTVKIGTLHFRVVGVSEKKGSAFGNSQDNFAIIPLSVFRKLFGSRPFGMQLLVKPKSPELVQVAMDDATVAMRIERRLRPSEPDNFGMFTSDTFLNIYKTATSGIFAVLVGVVAMSLVVGGIVIMNIMLMVVSERTREIGLRKALGARRRDIIYQILTESVTLSTFGGVVGTFLGFILAQIISKLTPLPAAVQIWSVLIGIGITAVVGLFFGMYPAMRAARLDPIEALRRE